MFKMTGYDDPADIMKWLWSQGYSQIGPMANNAPPIVRQILQQPGMQMDPTQFRSVGGYTPQFTQALNQAIYPNMGFRTGEQTMGQLAGSLGQTTNPTMGQSPQQAQQSSPYSDFMQKLMSQYGAPQNQTSLMDMVRLMQAGVA